MPETYESERPYPGKGGYRLWQAARDGVLVVVHCRRCKRTVHYIAADLLPLLGDSFDTRNPPFDQCGKCGSGRWLTSTLRTPAAGDFGSLVVRRPAGVRKTQLWASVQLGDPAPRLGDAEPEVGRGAVR